MKSEPNRAAQPVAAEQPPRLPFVVVGIGASAGGLEACSEFFSTLPADCGMAFVVIQHLPPDRESMMADILSRKTPLPVLQVDDGMAVEPNHVYVIRPGRTLTIKDGKLHLGAPLEKPGHTRPVDDFFRSLAEEQRERSICIILSGMGSNGTAGAQAIKVVGGLCIAQDPETALQPSMPRSVINAGFADQVAPPAEIPELLLRYVRHPYVSGGLRPEVEGREEQQITEILNILRTRTRHDFNPYKRPTILRRIQRRMGLNQIRTLDEYAKFARQNAAEVVSLADDLMIHVTGFFRDPAAWEVFDRKVVQSIVAEKPADGEIRCWAAACSSGEEAYTLAMLLTEAADKAQKNLNIKVFATDTAPRTLAHARSGLYPGGIESDLRPDRLERFFDKEDSHYRVKKELRESVVFAPQNLIQDPPFSRLDIVTCRNLLIYIEPETQRRVLSMLHFGLRSGGALFLGTSETISGSEDLFQPIDREWRIYRRIGRTRHGEFAVKPPRDLIHAAESDQAEPGPSAPLAQKVRQAILHRFSPACVVVDRDFHALYFHGYTDPYLIQPTGEPTRDLLAMAREKLRGTVRCALHEAVSHAGFGTARDGVIDGAGGRRRIEVQVSPLDLRAPGGNLLVTFVELPEPAPRTADGDEKAPPSEFVEELQRARDELRSTVEELQSSNEELKAANEEVISVNEELQSTNEELETSKEEMQSLNEELTTVNAQLHAKMEELERSSNDLSSLLSSTNIAVIFLDTDFRIRRFTPAMKELMDLLPSDVGRPLRDLNRKFTDPHLLKDAAIVLEKLAPVECEVAGETGLQYLRRALPYRTADNRIEGVVITFVDITEPKRTEQALARAKEMAEHANQAKDRFIASLSHELRTPLTPIRLATTALEASPDLTEEARQDLQVIHRNIDLETRLIDDLLDMSRIISGKLRVLLGPVRIHPVLEQVVEMVSDEVQAKQLTLETKLEATSDSVMADNARLHQIFVNLLRNAVKFTPRDGCIWVHTINTSDSIAIEVKDSGAGIEPEVLPRLFTPFEQGDPENARRSGGLGLGLAISKSLVEAHGGQINIQSEGKDRGVMVTVNLPLEPYSSAAPQDARQNLPPAIRKGTRVLLIEDHEDTSRLIGRLLKKLGCQVRVAVSVHDALKRAAEESFDLVVSDLGLPDGSGLALMRELLNRYSLRGIAVSGFGTEADIRRSLDAGFSQHLTKPLDVDELQAAIERLAEQKPPTAKQAAKGQ